MTITAPSQEQVDRIARELAPDVVRVRFNAGQDWSDHPAVYFRVVLSDEAARRERLHEVTRRVRDRLEELGLREAGILPYVNFRSASEQAHMREKIWD